MYDTILVPTDGSAGTEAAAAHAADLANETGASLHAVYVVDEATAAAEPEAPAAGVAAELRDVGEQALEAVAAVGDRRGVDVETELRHGTPHREILDAAEAVDADAVVMGTHGRSGVERYLLGSTTERVLRLADRPVTAVKLEAPSVRTADAAASAAAEALEAEGAELDSLRKDPYRERTTWVVPVETADGRRANVHVDAETGEARVAHLE